MYNVAELLNLLPAGARHVSTDTFGYVTDHIFMINGHTVEVTLATGKAPLARVDGIGWGTLAMVAGRVGARGEGHVLPKGDT